MAGQVEGGVCLRQLRQTEREGREGEGERARERERERERESKRVVPVEWVISSYLVPSYSKFRIRVSEEPSYVRA